MACRCGANEMWLDRFYTLQPGIPYNKTSILQLAENSFSQPGRWTGLNVVVVNDLEYNPLEHTGNWKRLSPEEVNFARMIGIKNAIDKGASDEVLKAYKVDLVSSATQFELHQGGLDNPEQTAIPRAVNIRESMRQAAKVGWGQDTFPIAKQPFTIGLR